MADICEGITGNGDRRCLCDEGDLGFKDVRNGSCPNDLLHGYQRTGQLKPAAFLAKWRKVEFVDGKSKTMWQWPNGAQQGFLLDNSNEKIAGEVILPVGTLIDRFGQENTVYFAPLGTPFAMRSLPPSSLLDEYAIYQVLKPLAVLAGPIAPGFEQPGLGTQYISRLTADNLFDGTWLKKVTADYVSRQSIFTKSS